MRSWCITLILVALCCLWSLSGCERQDDATVIRLAHGLPITHPVHKAMEFMAQRLDEKSAGTMRIEIYPGEQLGTERECLELMQIGGSIGITKVSAAVMESFAPAYEVLSLPYIFRDEAHCWAVLEGPIGREILDSGEGVSLRGLCFYDAGSRSFYSINRPIHEPADLQGLKIRVQESPTAKQLVNTLGGSATPIPWGELYSALQQGVVDGAENNPPSFYLSRHYEVARFYTLNEHTFVPDVLLVSAHTWEKLTAQQRTWLQEAADESSAHQRVLWKKSSDESLAAVEAAGVQIIRPDKSLFAEKIAPMLEQYRDDPELAALLDRIRDTEVQGE
ncbi:MAG: TRAP transporter substrate-binding protein [Phycisphaerales bacterium]|nr:TRAP transporter substrate-binding protein [Phycisphaerales bacterium]